MIFRQLFDPISSTYTYLLACPEQRVAVLIDPVLEMVARDMAVLASLNVELAYTVETHIHADHLTGARKLKHLLGSQIAAPVLHEQDCVDKKLVEGEPLVVGGITLFPLHTAGHTPEHHAYLWRDATQERVFTGDALLIDGCGRTDFQNGNPTLLYQSIHAKIFTLPDETLVYPGHDYNHRRVSSVGQEKLRNPRLGEGKTLSEFVQLMDNLQLPAPQKMQYAVPGNLMCGQCPPNVPEEFKGPCELERQG